MRILLIALVIGFSAIVDAAPSTFEQAKVMMRQHVYADRNINKGGDLYCGCDWEWVGRSGGRIIPESCGYEVRAQPHRGARTEWEHALPASAFGRQRQCWQDGGRANCKATDPVFNMMEADMFNLFVVNGELNADRSNFNFGVLPHVKPQHGTCPFKVDFKGRAAEPMSNRAKGQLSRALFYMHDRYGLNMSRQQQQLLMAWDKESPVSEWEMERNRRITKLMGHTNKFVTGERKWSLGHKPSGEGLVAFREAQQSQVPRTVSQKPQAQQASVEVRGNQNSKVYHLSVGCPSFNAVGERNRVSFKNEEDAVAAGFRKAGNCR